jgi:hypothetical protein
MNDQLIFSDGRTIYITLESKVRPVIKWLLIVLNIVYYSGILALFIFLEPADLMKALVPMLVCTGFVFYKLTRSMLWNVFGKERIQITKEVFSYQQDFGFYSTPLVTVPIEYGIATSAEETLVYQNEKYITLHFYNYDEHEIPSLMYISGIKTPAKNYKVIMQLMDELFGVDQQPNHWISMN